MLSKEEIEICKGEAKQYIQFMETAGDNAGWTRGLLWYIEQLETDKQKLINKLEDDVKKIVDTISEETINKYEKIKQEDISEREYELIAFYKLGFLSKIFKIVKGEEED